MIVSDRPVFARAVQIWLSTGRTECSTRILSGMDLARQLATGDPDVLLLMPQDWPEFAAWLPSLRRRFAARPWLLLADWRLVGMFLSFLLDQPCAIIEPGAPDYELGRLLESVANSPFSSPTHELLARFARGWCAPPSNRPTHLPTAMELQCGCAVSFGLRDAQIASLLQLSEATVKSHLHHFLRKLDLRNRVELGEFVRTTFAPWPVPLYGESSNVGGEVTRPGSFAREDEQAALDGTRSNRAGGASLYGGRGRRPRLVRKAVLGAGVTASG